METLNQIRKNLAHVERLTKRECKEYVLLLRRLLPVDESKTFKNDIRKLITRLEDRRHALTGKEYAL